MDLFHKISELIKFLRVLIQPLSTEHVFYRGNAGNDKSAVMLRYLQKEPGGLLVKMASARFHPAKDTCTTHGR